MNRSRMFRSFREGGNPPPSAYESQEAQDIPLETYAYRFYDTGPAHERQEEQREELTPLPAYEEREEEQLRREELPPLPAYEEWEEDQYPKGPRLYLILSSVFISVFLVSLDRLIVSTAIPAITDEFHSLRDIGWYGSAYMLTTCAFQLFFGKLYQLYPVRGLFAAAVITFEAGSTLCGLAPNTIAFICGRAIQGIGAAGMFSGGSMVIVYSTPLRHRSVLQGMAGVVFGISSIVGPLLGGVLTSSFSWRWCFYVNIPVGVIAVAIIVFFVRVPERQLTLLPTRAKIRQLDILGSAVLIPAVICLLMAMQWGGLTYPWNNWRVTLLLISFTCLFLIFIFLQACRPHIATLPTRILDNSPILAALALTTATGAHQAIVFYFLPIWFQAIQGLSAKDSGLRLLPAVLSMVTASFLNGLFIFKFGYYTPTAILGTIISSIGAGMLCMIHPDTPWIPLMGYEILYGFGMGLCAQTANLVAQVILPVDDVPIGLSIMFFGQLFGGALFLPIGHSLFNNQLLGELILLPGFSDDQLKSDGVTELIDSFPPIVRPLVIKSYNSAVRMVFVLALCLVCFSSLGAMKLGWKNMNREGTPLRAVPRRAAPREDIEADASEVVLAASEQSEVEQLESKQPEGEQPEDQQHEGEQHESIDSVLETVHEHAEEEEKKDEEEGEAKKEEAGGTAGGTAGAVEEDAPPEDK